MQRKSQTINIILFISLVYLETSDKKWQVILLQCYHLGTLEILLAEYHVSKLCFLRAVRGFGYTLERGVYYKIVQNQIEKWDQKKTTNFLLTLFDLGDIFISLPVCSYLALSLFFYTGFYHLLTCYSTCFSM